MDIRFDDRHFIGFYVQGRVLAGAERRAVLCCQKAVGAFGNLNNWKLFDFKEDVDQCKEMKPWPRMSACGPFCPSNVMSLCWRHVRRKKHSFQVSNFVLFDDDE